MINRVKVRGGVSFLFIVSTFFSLFLLLMTSSDHRGVGVMGALSIWALIGWYGVIDISKSVKEQWEIGDKACRERDERITLIMAEFLTQEIVDTRLRQLATAVEETFFVQTQLTEGEDEDQIEEVRERVIVAKERFWDTHALVKFLGFSVRQKIKHYTNEWDVI